jgi:hypothetical protein
VTENSCVGADPLISSPVLLSDWIKDVTAIGTASEAMEPESFSDSDAPMDPVYAFGPAGTTVILFEGEIGERTATSRRGRIELSLGPKASLNWEADVGAALDLRSDTVDLRICLNGSESTVKAIRGRSGGGWINHVEVGAAATRLDRIVVNWINLPSMIGLEPLTFKRKGTTTVYSGRWRGDIDGWSIALDQRPDHKEVFEDARGRDVHAVTHVMEIRRTDRSAFTADAVQSVIECLRISLSFAFGRWVAPILPVGFAKEGVRAWESWAAPICDPPRGRADGWLVQPRSADLLEFLTKSMAAFGSSTTLWTTRFQMLLGVEAARGGAFVEQRLISAFSAIESVEWVSLVLSGQLTENEYRRYSGARRLQTVLHAANIPPEIDPASLPALASFAQAELFADGPTALVEVRNRLVHPKRVRDDVYHIDGLAVDAWLLARHYATLLILHSIDYRGGYQRLLPPYGWAGTGTPVPWIDQTSK